MTDTLRIRVATIALATAHRHMKAAREAVTAATGELSAARLEQSLSVPHEWAGRKVKRAAKRWGGDAYTERGIVTLQSKSYGRYRGHHPSLGEWFVLTASGKTAYSLDQHGWELDE